jgi:hypothetical protein
VLGLGLGFGVRGKELRLGLGLGFGVRGKELRLGLGLGLGVGVMVTHDG